MVSSKVWLLEMSKEADKSFNRLDKPIKQRIISFFEERVLLADNPRSIGKALVGGLSGYWSYLLEIIVLLPIFKTVVLRLLPFPSIIADKYMSRYASPPHQRHKFMFS